MSLVELKDVVKRYGQQHRAERRVARGREGRDHRHHRPLGLRQEHHAALRQRAGTDPGRHGRLRRHGGERSRHRPAQAAPACRHRLPELQPLPAPLGREEHHAGAQGGEERAAAEARRLAEAVLRKVGLSEKIDAYPRPAVGRPAAARGDRPLARHVAAADAVRRDHLGARPGAGRRGAEGSGGNGARWHDHDAGNARDRLCPQGRQPRRLHASRQDLGGRARPRRRWAAHTRPNWRRF